MISIKLSRAGSAKVIVNIIFAVASVALSRIFFPDAKDIARISDLFAVLYLCAGFLQIETRSKSVAVVINLFWGAMCIACAIAGCVPLVMTKSGLYILALNYWCALAVSAVMVLLTAKWRLSISLSSAALAVLYLINLVVYEFRGKELGIMDVLSFRTALSVAGSYKFVLSKEFLITVLYFSWGLFSQLSIPPFPEIKFTKYAFRILAVIFILLTVMVFPQKASHNQLQVWQKNGTLINGYPLNFYLGMRAARIEKPQGYTPEYVEEYSNQFDSDIANPEEKPNIIIIMDESYADFRIFADEVSTNIPVTPFIDSLSENTVKGYALSSIFGGNTANSEFEFLTGHTMAFLPINTVPYQQYIYENMYSLPWLMRDYGYTTFATHPYYAEGFSRKFVYPFLGFEKSAFIESYPNQNIIREYISDQEMFEYIVEYLNNKEKGEHTFLFGITMQNHGGYYYAGENFRNTVELVGYSQEYPAAEQYLSLLHETDQAVAYFLNVLEEYPEDTVVLFFGDHFPSVEPAFFEELNGESLSTLDDLMLKHTVPFFIWANYDLPSDVIECTSLGYLGGYLLECAGLELPPYYAALKDIEEVIPAINMYGYYSKQEGCFLAVEDASGEETAMLETYRSLQYQNLFDPDNRNQRFYGQYLP